MIPQKEIEQAADACAVKRSPDYSELCCNCFEDGAQWAIDRISEQSADGFEEWMKELVVSESDGTEFERRFSYNDITRMIAHEAWNACAIFKDKRHAEEIKAKDARIEELEKVGSHLSAYQCVHQEALTIREGQDGITCAKDERIQQLEEALVEFSRLNDSYSYSCTARRMGCECNSCRMRAKYAALIASIRGEG